jgi:hypothetical protein
MTRELDQKDVDMLLPTAELERRKRLRKILFDPDYSCVKCGAPIFSDEPVKGQTCLDCAMEPKP